MAKLVTECPHCSTRYELSEAQYAAARGMVRCGRCRQPFHADIIKEVEQADTNNNVAATTKPSASVIKSSTANKEPSATPKQPTVQESGRQAEEASNYTTQLSVEYASQLEPEDGSDEPAMDVDEILANINAKKERQQRLKSQNKGNQPASTTTQPRRPRIIGEQQDAFDDVIDDGPSDEELIAKVDTLVESKLLGKSKTNRNVELSEEIEPFLLEIEHRPNRAFSIPMMLVLLAVAALMTGSLAYQLWSKQWLVFSPNSDIEKTFSNAASELNERLADRGYELETRRDLSKLELISAKTEPHASRSTTVLLRVSLMNHADIAQPLPWLQLSLTDETGKIVSRRALRPSDYLYNNTSRYEIGARELKKFTIEFLAFPKSATGYELRLLNR